MAWFPGKGEGAEGSRNVFGQLRAGGGVDGVWGGKGFEGSELGEFGDDLLWLGQDGDRVRLETGAWSVAGFEEVLQLWRLDLISALLRCSDVPCPIDFRTIQVAPV